MSAASSPLNTPSVASANNLSDVQQTAARNAAQANAMGNTAPTSTTSTSSSPSNTAAMDLINSLTPSQQQLLQSSNFIIPLTQTNNNQTNQTSGNILPIPSIGFQPSSAPYVPFSSPSSSSSSSSFSPVNEAVVQQLLSAIASRFDTEKEGNSIDKLLTPDFLTRQWNKQYLNEWARIFAVVRYKAMKKDLMNENSLIELLDDIITYILQRDAGQEDQAFNTIKQAVQNVANEDNKRINNKIMALANVLSPAERIKQNEMKKEKNHHNSSSSSSSSSSNSYTKSPRNRSNYHDRQQQYQPYPQPYHHAIPYAPAPQIAPTPMPHYHTPAPFSTPITPCGVCGKTNHTTEKHTYRKVEHTHTHTFTQRHSQTPHILTLTHSPSPLTLAHSLTPLTHPFTNTHTNVVEDPTTSSNVVIADTMSNDMNIENTAFAHHTNTLQTHTIALNTNNDFSVASMHADDFIFDNSKNVLICTDDNLKNVFTDVYTVNRWRNGSSSSNNSNNVSNYSKNISKNDANNKNNNKTSSSSSVAEEKNIYHTNINNKKQININSNTVKENEIDMCAEYIDTRKNIQNKHQQTFSHNTQPQTTNKFEILSSSGTSIRKSKNAIRNMLGYDKKNFSKIEKQCEYCEQVGHETFFCAKRPTNNTEASQLSNEAQLYVQSLLDSPQINLHIFSRCSLEEAMKKVQDTGQKLNEKNPWTGSSEPRDQLRARLGYWKAIGCTKEVLSWLAYGIEMRFEREPYHLEFKNHPSYYEHVDHVDNEHERHLPTGSWREVTRAYAKVVNPLQVEQNSRGKRRMCTDMRYPNSFTADVKFKLETLYTHLTQVVEVGDVMITTDMEQAYYSMAMHPSSWPYMVWKHKDKYYCSTVLTFGFNQAPIFFHKTMRVIVRFCRTLGIRVLNYLDDFLWACKPLGALGMLLFVKTLLPLLGWNFNAKCRFDPSPEVEFLGMIINAHTFWISAPVDKIQRIQSLVNNMQQNIQNRHTITVHSLQVLAGTIRSIKLAVSPASAWTRAMNILIAIADDANITHIDVNMFDVSKLSNELLFWSKNLEKYNGCSMDHPSHQLTVYSDTSVTGYGGTCGSSRFAQVLPTIMIGQSSTYRELYGLRKLTEKFSKLLQGMRVKFVLDSQPAVSNLTNGGGPKQILNEEIKLWWALCEKLSITPSYEWIPREENVEADTLSKANEFKHDLANMTSDAYVLAMQFCRAHNFEKFETPSFNSIDHRIRTLITDKQKSILVIPEWQAQAWWPTLMKKKRPCRELGNTRAVYSNENQTYAQQQGFSKSIPKWNMWIVLFDPLL
jgi:hypothetical protein